MKSVAPIKVSIIVPVYKVENYLTQCLDSIVHQTLRDIEIIVVDEGDLDRCREIIDYYERVDQRVIGIHEHNGGYGASVNKGIERARGEYIGIVESDDFIEPDMFEGLYECAKRTGASVVKSPFYCYYDPNKEHIDSSREFINQFVPKESAFSIKEFPHLLAIHPSLWSGLYKADEMQRKKVRCITAKGSGYADARFYVDIYTKMDSIAWLDRPYYHWRITSETSSCNNWNYSEILKRWNENLDIASANKELLSYVAPYFVTKSYSSIFAHYKKERSFNKEEYDGLIRYLHRYTDEQIQKAPRLTEKQKQELLTCKHNSTTFLKGLRPEWFPQPEPAKPEPVEVRQPEPEIQVVEKPSAWRSLKGKLKNILLNKKVWLTLYAVGIYSLLLCIAIQLLCGSSSAGQILVAYCAAMAFLCGAGIAICLLAWLYCKIKNFKLHQN